MSKGLTSISPPPVEFVRHDSLDLSCLIVTGSNLLWILAASVRLSIAAASVKCIIGVALNAPATSQAPGLFLGCWCTSHITLPGPVRDVPGLFWRKIVRPLMPQSHMGPIRSLSPARKAEWSARRNYTSVLFPWSHQAAGPVRPDSSAYLWFDWKIRKTPRVPCAMPVRASCGPRSRIFNVFHILRDPTGPVRDPQGCRTALLRTRKGIGTIIVDKNPTRASYLAVRSPHGLLTDCLQFINPYGVRK